jgi:hypothetical protein
MGIRNPAAGARPPLGYVLAHVHNRSKNGVASLAYSRSKNGLASLAYAGEPVPGPDQVRAQLSPGHALFLYHNATPGAPSSLPTSSRRTSLERIAAESLTRHESGFVPREIW